MCFYEYGTEKCVKKALKNAVFYQEAAWWIFYRAKIRSILSGDT